MFKLLPRTAEPPGLANSNVIVLPLVGNNAKRFQLDLMQLALGRNIGRVHHFVLRLDILHSALYHAIEGVPGPREPRRSTALFGKRLHKVLLMHQCHALHRGKVSIGPSPKERACSDAVDHGVGRLQLVQDIVQRFASHVETGTPLG